MAVNTTEGGSVKRYKTFPHTREALDTLYGERTDLRDAFDAEDREGEAELARAREAARAEEDGYQAACAVIRRAQWSDGPADV
jgi:hypothetical protein